MTKTLHMSELVSGNKEVGRDVSRSHYMRTHRAEGPGQCQPGDFSAQVGTPSPACFSPHSHQNQKKKKNCRMNLLLANTYEKTTWDNSIPG